MKTVRDYLTGLKNDYQRENIDAAYAIASEIIAQAIGCERNEIHLNIDQPISPSERHEIETMSAKVILGEPLQYVVGEAGFHDIVVKVDRRVLIPRPETELLVEEALAWMDKKNELTIIDLCTGSGCIAIALAVAHPADYTAIDLSADALALAKENAAFNCVDQCIQFKQNDLLAGIAPESADLIISNPPYISTRVCATLDSNVRHFEPNLALDGGDDGLDLIRTLIPQVAQTLKPGGAFFIEYGYDQAEAVRKLAEPHFSQMTQKCDLAGRDRMLIAIR